MRVDRDIVAHIAALAKIDLTADELDHYAVELSAILEYVDQLQQIPLSADLPRTSFAKGSTELRDDVPMPSLEIAGSERNAPAFREGFFVVPRIIGGAK